jgi:hypothetical protein
MSVNFPPNYFSPPTSTYGPNPQASASPVAASATGNADPLQQMDINQLLAMLGGGEATAGVAPVSGSTQSATSQSTSNPASPTTTPTDPYANFFSTAQNQTTSATASVDPYASLFATPSAAPAPSATNSAQLYSQLPAPAGSLTDAYGGTTGPVATVNQVSQAADPLAALFASPSAAPAASAQPPALNMAQYYPQSAQPGLKFNALA